jgi:hypothetical protein
MKTWTLRGHTRYRVEKLLLFVSFLLIVTMTVLGLSSAMWQGELIGVGGISLACLVWWMRKRTNEME